MTVEDEERHLAVAVVMDQEGRLLVDRATRSPLATEFVDSWPQDAAADLILRRTGADIPRSRMAATHVDMGAELFAHFLWTKLRAGEVDAIPSDSRETIDWVRAADLSADPTLVTRTPWVAEVLRLAFGWTDAAVSFAPAIPPKIDPSAVDWADPHVRAAALDAMAHSELDLVSGMLGDWEVTVGGGDADLFLLTADGPDGAVTALGSAEGDGEIDIRTGGQMLSLPQAYGLSRVEVEQAFADLRRGDLAEPRWEFDEA